MRVSCFSTWCRNRHFIARETFQETKRKGTTNKRTLFGARCTVSSRVICNVGKEEMIKTIFNVLSLLLMIFGGAITLLILASLYRDPEKHFIDLRGLILVFGFVILCIGILLKVTVQFFVNVAKRRAASGTDVLKKYGI
jgi:hypothetical protein